MFSIGGIGCGSFASSLQPPPSPPVEELIELSTVAAVDGYGDTHVNSAILRCSGPITDLAANVQYVAWHKQSPKTLKLAKRSYSSGAWGSWSVDTSAITPTTANDAHNFFSLGLDGSGRLHIAGDMHGVEMNYARLTGGGIHVSAWSSVPIAAGSSLEDLVTYPAFVPLPNGDLLMFFRDGGSGDGSLVMYRWDNAGATWTIVHNTLVDGETIRSFYPNQIRFDPVMGRLHIGGCWRETPSINTNHDIFYFYLELSDNFATAKKVDGSAQTLPVTQANAGYAMTIATGNGLVNTGGTAWFVDGRPILASFRDPGDGFTQLFLLYWDGAAWVHRWVPGIARLQQTIPFSVAGLIDTWIYSALSSPHLLHRNGRTIITFRADAYGTGVWAWICEEPTLQEWTLKQIDSTDIGEWTGSEDISQWQTNGEIYLYHQKAQRPQVDGTVIGAQDVRVLRWRPQSATYSYTAPDAPWDPDDVAGCVYFGNARKEGAKVHGTVDASRTRCNELFDARDQSSIFIQNTNSDAPEFLWNAFPGATLGHQGGVKFVAATLDKLQTTDATLLAALDGTNQPFTIEWAGRLDALAADSCLWSAGSSSTHYLFCTVLSTGAVRVERRSGAGAAVNVTSAAGLVTAGTDMVLTVRSDGAYVSVWLNGLVIIAPTPFATSGSMTLALIAICSRYKGASDQWASATCGSFCIYDNAVSMADRRLAGSELGAERGIAVTHDAAAPVLVSAVVPGAGTSVVLTFDEALDATSVSASSAFTLGGTTATVASLSLSGPTITLTLTGLVLAADTVTVSYAVPGSNKVRDSEQNNAAAISSAAVTNNSTLVAAPYFIGEAHQTDISSTTRTVDVSALGLATNDIVLMTIGSRQTGTVSVTVPAGEGWTKITESERIVSGALECTYWKRWGAGGGQTDDSTPTFTLSTSGLSWYATATVWRGCKTSGNPYTVTPVRTDHAASATLTAGLLGSAPGAGSTTVWVFQSTDDNTLNANTRGTLDLSFNCNSVGACAVVHEVGVNSSANACAMTESTNGNDTARILTLALTS